MRELANCSFVKEVVISTMDILASYLAWNKVLYALAHTYTSHSRGV